MKIVFEKLLTCVLMLCFAASFFFLYGGKNKAFGKTLLAQGAEQESTLNGDLYRLSRIDAFKENFKNIPLKESISLENAYFIVMGDSFFNTGFDSDPAPHALEKKSGEKVYYRSTSRKEMTPVQYLKHIGYTKESGNAKFFIWETIERKSLERALAARGEKPQSFQRASPRATSSDDPQALRAVLFDQAGVEYFIKNNTFTRPLRHALKNVAFDWFGDIDTKTPVYSKNPKLLFLDEEIEFHRNKQKQKNIARAAGAIAREAKILQREYSLTLIYVVVPDKFSVYWDTIPAQQSDNYIVELHTALDTRGVHFINVYERFMRYKKTNPSNMLYYGGDTHYTPVGKHILIDALVEYTRSLRIR